MDIIKNIIDTFTRDLISLINTVKGALGTLGALIFGVILIMLIIKAVSETRKGHPDAWKDEMGKIIVVAVLFVLFVIILAVDFKVEIAKPSAESTVRLIAQLL